jgi:serine/threonine-protein kinase
MKAESWQQIEELYHAALELTPDERAKFIASACADDDELRREIESLLECDNQARQFLEKPAREVVAQRLANVDSASVPLLPGQRLNSYEIRALIGTGGMGEVYAARDTRLDREVAIKVLPDYLARDPDRVRRFEREARAMAALNHPNIAQIYGFEQSDNKRFLVLELVPGDTLAERMNRGLMPASVALPIFRQIALALKAAHEKGIVHRDLKPANIKITPEGAVRVLDFGIARITRPAFAMADGAELSAPTVSDTLTREGMIIGTVAYLSPEQARGRERQLDHRADWWAFGCVLYEALTGQQPFRGATISDTLGAILSEEPDWRELPKQTPVSIQYLLRLCLEKEPERRLSDAAEIINSIDETASGAGSPTAFLRLSSLRLSRMRWRATLVLAVALVAFCVIALGLYVRERRVIAAIPGRKHLAVTVFQDQAKNDAFRAGLAEYLSASLARVSSIQVISPVTYSDAPREPDHKWLISNLGANLILSGTVQREGSRVRITWSLKNDRSFLIGAGSVDGANNDLLRLQDQVAERVTRALRIETGAESKTPPQSGPRDPAAQEHYLQALGYLQRDLDPAFVDKAIDLLEALTRSEGGSAPIHAALGKAYLLRHGLTLDAGWLEMAGNEAQKALELDPDAPEAQITLALVNIRRGQSVQAAALFRQALDKRPDDQDALHGLALTYEESNQPDEAEKIWRSAIARDPKYWSGYNELGIFFFNRGQNEKALGQFQSALELLPGSATLHTNHGNTLYALNRMDDAMEAYRQAIRLHPLPQAFNGLGTALFFQGRYAEAVEKFERAVGLSPNNAGLLGNLGDAYRWTPGAESKAAAAYDKAIELMKKDLALMPDDAGARAQLAEWQVKRGQTDEALNNITQALQGASDDPYLAESATVVYHLAGDRAQALKWAARAISDGYNASEFERDPELAGLRRDPAFQRLIRQPRNKP